MPTAEAVRARLAELGVRGAVEPAEVRAQAEASRAELQVWAKELSSKERDVLHKDAVPRCGARRHACMHMCTCAPCVACVPVRARAASCNVAVYLCRTPPCACSSRRCTLRSRPRHAGCTHG